ncbi:tyrosine kinase family protein [Mycobacterium kansasii]|uniref:non-specific serine/threonine protein kinase n=1 Tax=Mycobacterium kansasii TaxID=1768 RepID=A0A1V3X0I3_MYCKA|nr:tyrosine kinase family protein [Mycobacterium kansasii]
MEIGVKLCGALETAHRAGTLHRDIKPANVLVNDYGEPQLTDFGIAHIEGGFETAVGFFSGTIDYTAPEVMTGNPATVVADVYSLGATLYALIAGSAAHERKKGEDLVAQYLRISSTGVPDLRPDGIPDAVCSAIEKAMSIDPAERPASAAELGRELQAAQRRNGLKPASMAITNMRARSTDTSTDVPETPPVSPAILSPEAQVPLRTSSTVPLKAPQPAAKAGAAAAIQPPGAAGKGRPRCCRPSPTITSDHREQTPPFGPGTSVTPRRSFGPRRARRSRPGGPRNGPAPPLRSSRRTVRARKRGGSGRA